MTSVLISAIDTRVIRAFKRHRQHFHVTFRSEVHPPTTRLPIFQRISLRHIFGRHRSTGMMSHTSAWFLHSCILSLRHCLNFTRRTVMPYELERTDFLERSHIFRGFSGLILRRDALMSLSLLRRMDDTQLRDIGCRRSYHKEARIELCSL